MKKVIAIFGAGNGLAASVARLYAQRDYRIALVARDHVKLEALRQGLSDKGAEAASFAADLADAQATSRAISDIRHRFGEIDVVYFAPNPMSTFIPATQVTPEIVQPLLDLYFFGLIKVINATLPQMQRRKSGSILVALGGTAREGFPLLSGVGPAMAAARNYLQSLHKEVACDHVEIGLITITAIIQRSAFHESLFTDSGKKSMPVPEADPNHLATLLDEVLHHPQQLEVIYPPEF